MSIKTSNALAVALLLLALVLRLWDLTMLPPGLTAGEINDIRITETARRGFINVFYDLGTEGREGLYGVTLSAATSAVGGGLMGYRLLSVWAGMIALALVYALGKRLYSPVAALAAMALLAVGMSPILLSRMIGREAVLPALVTGVLVTLAHALSIPHWRIRRTPVTTSFAALALLLGAGFYIHPAAFFIALMSMVFIALIILTGYAMSRRQLGYIAFSIVVLVVITMPYLISSIRLPTLAGPFRVFEGFASSQPGPIQALLNGLAGIVFVGDLNPTRNLPGRPLIDIVSALFVILGVVVCVRFVRRPRYTLPLLAALVLVPITLMRQDSPNFLAMSALLPLIALFLGVGVSSVWHGLPRRSRPVAALALIALLVFNVAWTARDLFGQWAGLPDVQEAYNTRMAQVAHYLDKTAGDTPSIVCVSNLDSDATPGLDTFEILALMMHRQNAPLRYADCGSGLIFAGGGEREQLVFPERERLFNLHRDIRSWLADGALVEDENVPPQSVVVLDVAQRLANTVGRFTTTTPVAFPPEAPGEDTLTLPPVRFGGNITFLGYEGVSDRSYRPGDYVTIISYWRVDGIVPPDLRLFSHVLLDPTAIAAQSDTISVMPALLMPRDVFMQITFVRLSTSLPDGQYRVSIGAYEDNSDIRLNVFDGEQPRGTRLFLDEITIESNPTE